jgi:hypothetical protein
MRWLSACYNIAPIPQAVLVGVGDVAARSEDLEDVQLTSDFEWDLMRIGLYIIIYGCERELELSVSLFLLLLKSSGPAPCPLLAL